MTKSLLHTLTNDTKYKFLVLMQMNTEYSLLEYDDVEYGK
jgi:hypothetical protein